MASCASYIQGYDEERFLTTIDRNFLCLICFNVLREPFLCATNQHCFCRSCITRHLENFQRCPTCADELTLETLAEPQRMIKDYLNEAKIRCTYIDRGCQEVVQLQHLDHHEDTCGYKPAVCTNQGCGVTVNKRDLIYHEIELCQLRKLKCHSCGEIAKTLDDLKKRIANVEKQTATNFRMEAKIANMEKNVLKLERNCTDIKADMERNVEASSNQLRGLQAALTEGFDQMKEVLVKMEDIKEENQRKVQNTPSGDRESIIVAGGYGTNSVEMFNWRQRLWLPLQSMSKNRWGATSFVYNNHMTVAGGWCFRSGSVDDMIKMNIDQSPDLSKHWSGYPVKLPAKLAYHSSVLYNDQLMVTGGHNELGTSQLIYDVQLIPPHTMKALLGMPEPRQKHCMEIFDDNLLIVGGSTTGSYQDNLSSVILYNIKKKKLKNLSPLPHEVSWMATVKWGDNIVVLGGLDKQKIPLDKVIIYNVKTGESHMLPPMRCKRYGCTAVVIGNNIVVLGGVNEHLCFLKSVEAFNFERYTWEELPEMSEERWFHTAAVV